MKPEKQRIKIAEACGWVFVTCGDLIKSVSPDGYILSEIPDYLNDLNAMHQAEKLIPPNDRILYAVKLELLLEFDMEVSVVDDDNNWSMSPATSRFSVVHTTAAQRAEAFLKMLNLWEETP